jgi:hypothetical protein
VAEQAASSTVHGAVDTRAESAGQPPAVVENDGHFPHPPGHGRPISWIAVCVIVIGFIVGGAGMVPHPTWWIVYLGAGIAVIGCIIIAAARTLQTDWY